jgi:hypothetical protein
MNKQGFLISSGGVATALMAHALFFSALVAGQPRPEQYLAQLEAVPAAASEPAQRHCDACAVAMAEAPGLHRLRF